MEKTADAVTLHTN